MIPPSVQKMIEEEAYKFYKNYILGPPSLNYNPHKCFKSGASFSYELGFSQGMKEIESLQAKLKVAKEAAFRAVVELIREVSTQEQDIFSKNDYVRYLLANKDRILGEK